MLAFKIFFFPFCRSQLKFWTSVKVHSFSTVFHFTLETNSYLNKSAWSWRQFWAHNVWQGSLYASITPFFTWLLFIFTGIDISMQAHCLEVTCLIIYSLGFITLILHLSVMGLKAMVKRKFIRRSLNWISITVKPLLHQHVLVILYIRIFFFS